MPTRQSQRKRVRSRAQTDARVGLKPSAPVRQSVSTSAEEVRDYIADMAAGLAELALANRLDSLAVACDVVREIAQGNVAAEARLVKLS
jgi:hypothetical protein